MTHSTDIHIQKNRESVASSPTTSAVRIVLSGRVQGLGVRPAIVRWAGQCSLNGFVRNHPSGVEIQAEGSLGDLERFRNELKKNLPLGCVVDEERVEGRTVQGLSDFSVGESVLRGENKTRIPVDQAVCGECLREAFTPGERRYRYPLITCAQCGPRYSILHALPFDRRRSGMSAFALCPACRAEYDDPRDRRFHAETISCPACGPKVFTRSNDSASGAENTWGEGAIAQAVAVLKSGRIVALKGIGGYQLLCDATDSQAVKRLRVRKQRREKPLAVMVQNVEEAERWGHLDSASRTLLQSPENPIVLFPARGDAPLAAEIHPGLTEVGIFLPTSALHAMLCRETNVPLVVTSGNREGEPLAHDPLAAQRDLAEIADVWLHHDRPIIRPIDDSLLKVIAGKPVALRLGRGYAPLPLALRSKRPIIALGGHQKTSLAYADGERAFLGPHIGDMDALAAREHYVRQFEELKSLAGREPRLLVHDLHPDYFTNRWGLDQKNVQTLAVQHHHAHVAAGMLEQGWLERTVLGVAWDGTGYGPDGTVWGGEFLIASGAEYRRAAHLLPFPLLGGDRAVREPWRVALALLQAAFPARDFPGDVLNFIHLDKVNSVRCLASRPHFGIETTSAGRLFDAAASLIFRLEESETEGFPAMRLEGACDPGDAACHGEYPMDLIEGETLALDWRPLFRALVEDLRAKTDTQAMAMKFHRGLVRGIAALCARFPEYPIVLCGGVFQNRVLTESVQELLHAAGREVGTPGLIPPGDGGLAAGQLAIACALEQDDSALMDSVLNKMNQRSQARCV